MSIQRRSPRQLSKTGQGQKTKHPKANLTTTASELQGLRFAINRFSQSKDRLRFSIITRRELLDILNRNASPDSIAHIVMHEQKLRRTEARLADVECSLAALYAALLRLEGTV